MVEIDGSRYSGSGTVVRQAVAFGALTARPVRILNARASRPKPGLRPQHVRVVEAIRELVDGNTEGVRVGSQEFTFWPGALRLKAHYVWDIGSAGSTVLLAIAVLPVLAFAPHPVRVELRGGIFQDFAPSVYHLQQVLLPVLARMNLQATVEMARPGYVPQGGGILHLATTPAPGPLRPTVLDRRPSLESVSGIALASHLEDRGVARRMAQAAQRVLLGAGHRASIETLNDTTAAQPGGGLALFANLAGGWRLASDCAGARGRPAEFIGRQVAQHLLEDLATGATLDRFAADQVIPFAALAEGESRFRVPRETEHIRSNAWLAHEFLGAEVRVDGQILSIRGVGFRPA